MKDEKQSSIIVWLYSCRVEEKKGLKLADAAKTCKKEKRPDKACSAALLTVEDLDSNSNIGKFKKHQINFSSGSFLWLRYAAASPKQ